MDPLRQPFDPRIMGSAETIVERVIKRDGWMHACMHRRISDVSMAGSCMHADAVMRMVLFSSVYSKGILVGDMRGLLETPRIPLLFYDRY
jgi:hypothetical protein